MPHRPLRRYSPVLFLPVLGLAGVVLGGAGSTARPETTGSAPVVAATSPLVFGRDIRPLLSDRCFACHGPDPAKRSANLRLDLQESAFAPLPLHPDQRAIVPGDPEKSVLIQRITSSDPLRIMPPPSSHLTLTASERDLLTRWIREGARYTPHFAYVVPQAPAAPAVQDATWIRNEVDRFVLARLEEQHLPHAPEADKATLLRRVSLDLTGLPPTPAELDAFVADPRADAYERQVDRLLASPRYGEHLAAWWLDLARYADSHGFQSDPERFMSPWRDWVINAFNGNMPFDRFTLEQLAGDLLPNATEDQIIATGFNRNHRINSEGGAIDEEWRIEQVLDRSETTSAVWLGLTMNCARCHDHKYDPITQKDYFQFGAFFNNVDERGLDDSVNAGKNSAPLLYLGTPEQRTTKKKLEQDLANAETSLKEVQKINLSEPLKSWIAAGGKLPAVAKPIVAVALDGQLAGATSDDTPVWVNHNNAKVLDIRNQNPCVTVTGAPPLVAGQAVSVGWLMQRDADKEKGKAGAGQVLRYDGGPGGGLMQVRLDDQGRLNILTATGTGEAREFHLETLVSDSQQTHVLLTWDGNESGLEVRLGGELHRLESSSQDAKAARRLIAKEAAAKAVAAIKRAPQLVLGGSGAKAKGADEGAAATITALTVHDHVLADDAAAHLALPTSVATLLAKSEKRSEADDKALDRAYRLAFTTQDRLSYTLNNIRKAQERLIQEIPNVMVMKEMPTPRKFHILERGQYDHPQAEVTAGTPSFLPAMAKDAPTNRLGLARWLVEGNPLTARVLANRMWERLFGMGIVKTTENMGVQCNWPSHPELLDHLAVKLVEEKWDLKAFLRLLVTSATYRQDTRISAASQEQDPENRLLWHGPRFRLGAEAIRDQALATSGLLVDKIGGPSVRPYLPADIWSGNRFGNLAKYELSEGEDLWRRSLYTFHKRTAPPTNSTLFDMPSREYCTISRSRTNTPLQALALFNDPTYLEASRVLGQRMLREGGSTAEQRVTFLVRQVLVREPRPEETALLAAAWTRHQARYTQDVDAAKALLNHGKSPLPADLPVADVAAGMLVASTVLNLDETVNKP